MSTDYTLIVLAAILFGLSLAVGGKKLSKGFYIAAIVIAGLYLFTAFEEKGSGIAVRWSFLAACLVCAWLFTKRWDKLEQSGDHTADVSCSAKNDETQKFCPSCGKLVSVNDNFCIYCGSKC